jgi:hypothetical protein
LAIGLLHPPFSAQELHSNLRYTVGRHPALYSFFSRQPKGILIASLTEEVDQLPTFTQRSILAGQEYAIPYHTGYYRQFQERTKDLVRAQYSPSLAVVQDFIRKYGVDYWLVDRKGFTAGYLNRGHHYWIRHFAETREASKGLKQGRVPALAGLIESCSVFENHRYVVLDAGCIVKSKKSQERIGTGRTARRKK